MLLEYVIKCGNGDEIPYSYTVDYDYQLEPVIADGKETWRSVPNPDYIMEQTFDNWIKKNKHKSRFISEWEAIDIFKDNLWELATETNNTDLLWALKNLKRDRLDVERAREFPIETLIAKYGFKVRMNKMKCPFHDDPNASLHVYKNNTWWCFGCQQGSSVIDFVMKMQKCGFVEAVKYLTN